jgi:hypothetical protein
MSVLGNVETINFELANVSITEQKKNPDRPKEVRSAKIYFVKHNRGRISEQNPNCTSVEVVKICNGKFMSLDAKTKKTYTVVHKAGMMRFKHQAGDGNIHIRNDAGDGDGKYTRKVVDAAFLYFRTRACMLCLTYSFNSC